MVQRNFNEIELREMLSRTEMYEKDIDENRFKINASFRNRRWEIIVEPDFDEKILVIITAYMTEE